MLRSLICDLNVGVQCVLFSFVDDIRLAVRVEASEDMFRIRNDLDELGRMP